MITQTYYISTGAKNAMYTLRMRRDGGVPTRFDPDFYLCTLAATEDRAVDKAREYFDAMRDRIADSEGFRIQFMEWPENDTFKRRGKLSVRDTMNIQTIESGVFPFGKYAGTRIEDAPASYVLFFADKSKDENEPVIAALAAACTGIALERGYIAKRAEARSAQAVVDALSNHIGTVGERRDFEGEVFASFFKRHAPGCDDGFWINKVRCGSDIVSYVGGKSLGEVGRTVRVRATIKKHETYNGVKSTQVSRPMAL